IATQNRADAGGTTSPATTATAVKTTAEVAQWTARVCRAGALVGARRSRNVAATRQSIPAGGTAYAHGGAPAPGAVASTRQTSATPVSPIPRPAHWRPVTATPRSGPARAATTSGCNPSMRAVV